jgi:nickel-dependent lactate racemase
MKQHLKGKIFLKYGKESIALPSHVLFPFKLLQPDSQPVPHANPETFINTILDSPTGIAAFNEFFRKGNSVIIVVSDITRITLSQLYLPVLVDRLNKIGIPDRDITLLCALGIHRKQTDDEHRSLIGNTLYERLRIQDHDPYDNSSMIIWGETTRGTPIAINHLLTEADKIILTGSIRFHYFAGFSGGRKSILPGLASFNACVANHLLVLSNAGEGGRHPRARPGVLQGNPVHEDMEEAAALFNNLFLFNTIVSPERRLLHAVAGDAEKAFKNGCQFLRDHFTIPFSSKADLVIASCGGYPWDLNFIQAHKTMDMASSALKDGGVMILLAECSQGFGNPSFLKWFTAATPKQFEKYLRKSYEINGQTAFATFLKTRKHQIILISRLKKDEVVAASMTPADTLEEALEKAYGTLGKRNPLTYVLSEGSSYLPYFV